jgi:hypothetical protein
MLSSLSLSFLYSPPKKIGFDNVLLSMKKTDSTLLISTLSKDQQQYLIHGTINPILEEQQINKLLEMSFYQRNQWIIILYGENSVDESVEIKYKQLMDLGFSNKCVYIYYGGLFEWGLLQEVFGKEEFPTTGSCKNILKYKAETLRFTT